MSRIIILEGADGTGKTTLADEINYHTKGSIIHATFRKDQNMLQYHTSIMQAAMILAAEGDTVVLDRWAPSELVYGNVFRDGPSYDVDDLIEETDLVEGIDFTWIYCRNDNAVENHFKNNDKRKEMFDDMTGIVKGFDDYMEEHEERWVTYDFDKDDMREFVKGLLNG